jgi:TrbC/VIRB2 pilin
MKSKILSVLSLLAFIQTLPAHAAGGGTSLAFNDTLETIYSNLSGPTANIVCGCLVVSGLIGLAVSRESGWLKTIGGLAIVVACIAKAPTLMSQLGLGGAGSTPDTWVAPFFTVQLGIAALGVTFLAHHFANRLHDSAR